MFLPLYVYINHNNNNYNKKGLFVELWWELVIITTLIINFKIIIERFSIAFTAKVKRQAEISRLTKTSEIYLVSAYILPVSHSYGARTTNREIS